MSLTKKTDTSIPDIQALSLQVEKEIINRFKWRFVGFITAVVVINLVLGYVGYEAIKMVTLKKVSDRFLDVAFQDKVIREVTEPITHKADSLITDLDKEHEALLDAATLEFERTLTVLRQVRESHKKR